MRQIAFFTALSLSSFSLQAQEPVPDSTAVPASEAETPNETIEQLKEFTVPDSKGTASFYLENDLFTNTDQDYTNGIRLSVASPELDEFSYDFLGDGLRDVMLFLDPLLSKFHPTSSGISSTPNDLSSRRVVFAIGQEIYTPDDKQATEVIEDQRPYAGWLYAGMSYMARYNDTLRTAGVNIGMVGPASLAEESQDFIHKMRGIDQFNGWDNQLNNELGIQLLFEQKDKLINNTNPDFGYDLISHFGGSLGNVATYLNTGMEARVGWNIPNSFGTSGVRSAADSHTPDGPDTTGFGLHAFVSVDGRWVLQDIFLDGNTFSDSHSVDKEPLVGEAAVGFSLHYDNIIFTYANIYVSKEYKTQPGNHDYGSLSLTWEYKF